MVFKKLVSGIASLAIAGSMFAGLAVTASAEGALTGSYDESTGVFSWTTADATSTSTTTWSTTDDDSYADLQLVSKSTSNKLSADGFYLDTASTNGLNTTVYGYVAVTPKADGTFEFTVKVTNNGTGSSDYSTYVYSKESEPIGKDNTGSTEKAKVSINAGNGTTEGTATIEASLEKDVTYYFYTYQYYGGNSNRVNCNFYDFTFTPATTPSAVKVSYTVDGTAIKSDTTTLTDKAVGDSYAYATSAYVTGDDSKLYKADSTTFGGTIDSLAVGVNKVSVPVTAVTGDVTFVEGESTLSGGTSSSQSNASGGAFYRQLGKNSTSTYTVTNAGVYNITLGAASQSTNQAKTVYIKRADGTEIASVTPGNNECASIVASDITLSANEVLYFTAGSWSAGVDYLVLEKTADVYTVTTTDTTSATVTATPTVAAEGDTVTVTATAADGYENPVISVTTASGTAVTVTDGTFTMPAENVTVTATATKKTHAEAFTFNGLKVSDLGDGKTLKVTFKDTDGNVSELTEKLTSSTTFSGVADASIAVIVTDITDGYSVNSITIE